MLDGENMTKNDYMQRLYNALSSLPNEKRNKIMHDYEAHFSEELNAGKTENIIIDDLGAPEAAAEYFININKDDHGYNDNYSVDSSVIKNNTNTAHSWEAAIWSMLSILIVPILIALMIVLFAVGVGFFVAGITSAVVCFLVNSLSAGFILLGIAGIFITVFGVFTSILAIYDGVKLIGKYFKFVGRRIKFGGKKA